MKANELRVGNHIQNGIVVEIKHTVSRIKYLYLGKEERYCFNDYADLIPIPLTEEWLVKSGFEKVDDSFFLKGFEVWQTDCGNEKGNEYVGFFYPLRDRGMMDLEIKFIHQLQNLYFALTGEELKIK